MDQENVLQEVGDMDQKDNFSRKLMGFSLLLNK